MAELYPYQQRVVEEHDELQTKITKLRDFINDKYEFDKLPNLSQDLLLLQHNAMQEYSMILKMRIRTFNK